MFTEHQFDHDGLTYHCAWGMTPPPIGWEKDDFRRAAYWDVVRSDGTGKRVWVPRGREYDSAGLEAATLQEFGVSDS